MILLDGIGPLTGVEVETQSLVERAGQVSAARKQLAKRMREAEEESTQARPLGMYQ